MINRQAFPLSQSYLCADCDQIGNCATQCLCGSTHGLMSLSAVLNRDPVAVESKAVMGVYREVMNERIFA